MQPLRAAVAKSHRVTGAMGPFVPQAWHCSSVALICNSIALSALTGLCLPRAAQKKALTLPTPVAGASDLSVGSCGKSIAQALA